MANVNSVEAQRTTAVMVSRLHAHRYLLLWLTAIPGCQLGFRSCTNSPISTSDDKTSKDGKCGGAKGSTCTGSKHGDCCSRYVRRPEEVDVCTLTGTWSYCASTDTSVARVSCDPQSTPANLIDAF